MKIALILSSNIKYSPYVGIFKKVLEANNVDFDIISWDRESLNENEGIIFKYPAPNTRSKSRKFRDYYMFSRFAKRVVKQGKYDKLIVFGAAIGVFMYDFLNKYYRNDFWFDYRDLTIEQKFMGRFKKLLDISSYISISSPGFKSVIPTGYDFIISHNFDIEQVRNAMGLDSIKTKISEPMVVSNIGFIRDYESNLAVMKALANDPSFVVKFVGRGYSAEDLQKYARENHIKNIDFHGFYLKKDEGDFYCNSDFINIYLPRIPSHSTPMSNRFYQALLFRKPMIVTNRSTQGEYVEQYDLGLSVEDCSDLSVRLKRYRDNFDAELFDRKCKELLIRFVADYDRFEAKLLEFLGK